MTEPNHWHRIGVIMSLVSLAVVIIMGVIIINVLPPNWHVVTRHSDRPPQVIEAVGGLESEIDFRIAELESVRDRARVKAAESRSGIGEPGETIDDKKRAELLRLAPEWDQVAAKATAALAKYHRTP